MPAVFSITARIGLLDLSDAQLTMGEAKRARVPLRSISASWRLREILVALLRFGEAVAQHQMRKIQHEGMRRHIGAFGHEAHVAKRAGFDHRLEIFRLQMLDIFLGAGVDQVEQARERNRTD